jgi:hypothetical protein
MKFDLCLSWRTLATSVALLLVCGSIVCAAPPTPPPASFADIVVDAFNARTIQFPGSPLNNARVHLMASAFYRTGLYILIADAQGNKDALFCLRLNEGGAICSREFGPDFFDPQLSNPNVLP